MNDKTSRALKFAEEAHREQFDDLGLPYFNTHILQVFGIIRFITEDEDIIAAALLHDVIEDTAITYDEIVEEFGPRVANLVMEVTHEGQKDQHGYYFPRLQSKDGILIKFADRLSNLSRMDNWPTKRKEQYLRKSKFWRSE